MRTLIVDDHRLFSEGLRLLLCGSTAIQEIICCESGAAAISLMEQKSFDLVLLDWNLGSAPTGLALLQELKVLAPSGRIVIVSGECDAEVIRSAIDHGAVGFVPKESSSSLMVDALAITAHGGIYLPRAVLGAGATGARPAAGHAAADRLRSIEESFPGLTKRQGDVLSLLMRGMSNKLIARKLEISEGTVKQHLNTIFRELGVQSRTEAVYLLAKGGIVFD